MKALSILIPTLVERWGYLNRILRELERQIKEHQLWDDIEIIIYKDNRENIIGAKRNALVEAARGEFLVFIDDDDMVAHDYCILIVRAITRLPEIDYVGFQVKYTHNGNYTKPTFHSLAHGGWKENTEAWLRDISHLNPIRTAIARKVRFPEVQRKEDTLWADGIRAAGLCRREFYVEKVMYYYLSSDEKDLSFDTWEFVPVTLPIIWIGGLYAGEAKN